MKTLGKCPCCGGLIEVRKKEVSGKKVELYACENAHWTTEDGEFFEPTKESTCSFRIWQNALRKYGYWLKNSDVRRLLQGDDVIVTLKSKKTTYKKYIAIHETYGVEVLFDIDVEEEE